MKQIGIRQLREYLNKKPRENLVDEIILLYNKYPEIKDYYQFTLSSDGDSRALDKYRKMIRNEFFPNRGLGKLRLSEINKAIRDFKKVSDSVENLAELMLYYVENGIEFIKTYGDIDEPFYESMENVYENTARMITEHGLKDEFHNHFENLVYASDFTGYEFGETIEEIFNRFFR